jgi:hypothetical protein
LLDNELVKPQFLCCPFQHSFLDTAFSDETENVDLLGLANSMSSVHGLQISLRVPVAIVEDYNISASKIDTKASRTSCEKEDELVAARSVIFVDARNTVVMAGTSINSTIC